jgi:hypothetical protein
MKGLLTVTAVLEAGAGVALIALPSATATLLIGAPLTEPVALSVARVGGTGLLALAVACWCARADGRSRAASGLVAAMLLYNLGTTVILGTAGLQSASAGVALWPAVVVHIAMAAWCIVRLLGETRQPAERRVQA